MHCRVDQPGVVVQQFQQVECVEFQQFIEVESIEFVQQFIFQRVIEHFQFEHL